ncbi:excisionase [Sulfuriferula sp.]|uniref:excisionase n=1 Tax=Sulfuriferula sp. TaxID=2025307 RepID=UPI002731681F|nr:excisionase [Sulfuriferula sp.]MDP2026412.1 excisionase [Sulfuriferula sp.]
MKHITLTAWAERQFDPAPKLPTLRAWAASGRISPAPIKVGRTWMVRQDAEYCVASYPNHDDLSARARAILSAAA